MILVELTCQLVFLGSWTDIGSHFVLTQFVGAALLRSLVSRHPTNLEPSPVEESTRQIFNPYILFVSKRAFKDVTTCIIVFW